MENERTNDGLPRHMEDPVTGAIVEIGDLTEFAIGVTPLVPRRRKNAVDEEALNAEATGEEVTPHARALAAIANSPNDATRRAYEARIAALEAENHTLRMHLRGARSQIAALSWREE